jgi:hypothetical protein
MAEQIDIAKFNFNIDDVVKGATVLKEQIDQLKASQKELTKEGKTSSVQFVQQDANLKLLNAEYGKHIKAINADTKAIVDSTLRADQLSIALSGEATSIAQVREQNKLLNKLRNETNVTTKKGQEEIKQLNAQLDKNNLLVKNNADAYLSQKLNIGNYQSALSGISPQLGGMITQLQGVASSLMVFKEGMIASAGATTGTAKALKILKVALISTGIGAIVVLLGSMVGLFLKSREGVDFLTRALGPLKEIFQTFLGVLERGGGKLVEFFSNPQKSLKELGELIKQNIINRFEAAISIAGKLGDAFLKLIQLDFSGAGEAVAGMGEDLSKAATGVVDLSGKLSKLASETKTLLDEAVTRGNRLAELSIDIEKSEIELIRLRGTNILQLRQAELIAKDKQKTDAERTAALEDALRLTNEIEEAEGKVLDKKIEQKKLSFEANSTDRNQLRELATLEAEKDLKAEATIKAQLRFLGTKNSLIKEGEARAKKAQDEAIKGQQEELDLFLASQGKKARTLQEELELERLVSEQKVEILDAELAAKKISQEKYETDLLGIKQSLAGKEAEIAVESARMELDIYRESLGSRREDAAFLSAELAVIRQEENNALLEEQRAFFAVSLEQGKINQTEFDQGIRDVKEENRIANAEIDAERAAVEKAEATELRLIEFEESLVRMEEEKASQFELETAIANEQTALKQEQNQSDFDNKLISQQLFEARRAQIDQQANQQETQRDKILADQKVALLSAGLSAAAGLVDKNSVAGKAIAVAQAGINTFQGVTGAIAATPGPVGIAMGAIVGAMGAVSIAKIISTKVPSASGKGAVGGGGANPASGAGRSTGGSVGGVNLGSANLTNVAASGNATVQQQLDNNTGRNVNQGMKEAVEAGALAGTEQGANDGLTNLADNRSIATQSSF